MMLDANAFWNYYNNVTNHKNSEYKNFFGQALDHAGVTRYTLVNYVKSNITSISKSIKVYMLTKGVPQGVVRSILTQFKKWLNEYY